jgi:hypothetical protein
MGRLTEKEIICRLIELHQQVILSGGVSHRTWFRSLLSRRQHSLLAIFKLPATKENLLTTVTYPCSQTVNSVFEEALCKHPSGYFQHRESSKNKESSKNITIKATGSLSDIQVEFVYDSLMMLVKQYKKS